MAQGEQRRGETRGWFRSEHDTNKRESILSGVRYTVKRSER